MEEHKTIGQGKTQFYVGKYVKVSMRHHRELFIICGSYLNTYVSHVANCHTIHTDGQSLKMWNRAETNYRVQYFTNR